MKRIAIVVSTIGYHWEELFAACDVFESGGATLEFYTVDGSQPKPDPLSIKKSPLYALGFGVSASMAPDTTKGAALRARLLEVQPVSALDPAQFDGLYLPGGHGCLFDVNRHVGLHGKVRELYARGALLSGVCHATSTFAFVQMDGRSIVQGHHLTGFPNPLDQALIRIGMVRKEFLPLPLINDDELRVAGALLSKMDVLGAMLDPHQVRVSLPFVTGVGPKAAARVASVVLAQLGTQPDTTDNSGAMPNRASATA